MRQVEIDLRHLPLQTFFGPLLRDVADAHADSHTAVALVDEEPAVSVGRDAGGSGRGHGGPPFVGEGRSD
jgi:hypothetical protein